MSSLKKLAVGYFEDSSVAGTISLHAISDLVINPVSRPTGLEHLPPQNAFLLNPNPRRMNLIYKSVCGRLLSP
jgi:hypothetical protein